MEQSGLGHQDKTRKKGGAGEWEGYGLGPLVDQYKDQDIKQ